MDLLAHLETYVAVAEARSFTRAAETLEMPQPVLSRRVQALERELGGALFDRTRRQIEVTELGRALLPLARDLLDRSAAVLDTARALRGAATVTLGVPPDSDDRALADLVARAASIGLSLTVRDLAAAERDAALAGGELTLALVRVPEDMSELTVPVGIATRDQTGVSEHSHVYLEDLRPRRGARTGRTQLLVGAEDQLDPYLDRLTAATARAGLATREIRRVRSTAEAVVDVLSGRSVLLCSEVCARNRSLDWRPLGDPGLGRGYRLRAAASAGEETRRRFGASLLPAVARAVGATLREGDPSPATASRALLGTRP